MKTSTPSELIARHGPSASHLPLPVYPTTWAGTGGLEFFLGNQAQETLFQLMGYVYGLAKLTDNPDLIDLALWLTQSDNLHLIQWFGRTGPEAEVSAYFTPSEWWALGPNRIIAEQQQVYMNALRAIEPYLPPNLKRPRARKQASKTEPRIRELDIARRP